MADSIQLDHVPPPAESWAFFDKIYCISLIDRIDRRTAAQASFAQVGLADRVEFYLTEKHATDSERGVYESHLACLKQGIDADAQTILIFEDDVMFRHFSQATLADVVNFLRNESNWHACFFGCMVTKSWPTPYNAVRKIRYRNATHAYAASRAFAEQLVRQPFSGTAYDDMLRSLRDEHMFMPEPAFAFQSNASTDNDKIIWIDRARRMLGGLYRLQRINEFAHRRPIAMLGIYTFITLLHVIVVWYVVQTFA